MTPSVLGLLVGMVGAFEGSLVLIMAAPVGSFIGAVWALSMAGAFSTRHDPKSTPSISGVEVTEEIRNLAELNTEGILTDDEFESKKQELLAKL